MEPRCCHSVSNKSRRGEAVSRLCLIVALFLSLSGCASNRRGPGLKDSKPGDTLREELEYADKVCLNGELILQKHDPEWLLGLIQKEIGSIRAKHGEQNLTFAKCLLFEAHLQEILDKQISIDSMLQAIRIQKNHLGPQNSTVAQSLQKLATAYNKQGDYEHALQALLQAIEILERNQGANSPEVADMADALADVYLEAGMPSLAEPWLIRIVKIRRYNFWPTHPKVAMAYVNLAWAVSLQSRTSEAEKLYLQAFQILDISPDASLSDKTIVVSKLARLYRASGKYNDALKLLTKLSSLYQASNKEKTLDFCDVLKEMSLIYEDNEQLSEAIRSQEQALKIHTSILGPRHRRVAIDLDWLGYFYKQDGQLDKAEALLLDAMKIWNTDPESIDPEAAYALHNLAEIKESKKYFDLAENFHKQAVQIREKALGPVHVDIAISLQKLGRHYSARGMFQRAMAPLTTAHSMILKIYGPNHLEYAHSLVGLADLDFSSDQIGQAEVRYKQALRIFENIQDSSNKGVIICLIRLRQIYSYFGKTQMVKELEQRIGRLEERKTSSAANRDSFQIMMSQAEKQQQSGRCAKVEDCFLQILAAASSEPGDKRLSTAYAKYQLAEFLLLQGKNQDAEKYYQQSIDDCDKDEDCAVQNRPYILLSVGRHYKSMKNFTKAEELFLRAYRVLDSNKNFHFGSEINRVLFELSFLYADYNQIQKAIPFLRKSFKMAEERIRLDGLILSDDELASYLERYLAFDEHLYYALQLYPRNQSVIRLALSVALLRKGRISDEMAQITTYLASESQSELREMIADFKELRRKYAISMLTGSSSKASLINQATDSLSDEVTRHAEQFARKYSHIRAARALPGLDEIVDKVAGQLPKNTALIEVVRARTQLVFVPHALDEHYLALVLQPDGKSSAVDLGSAREIDEDARQFHQELREPPCTAQTSKNACRSSDRSLMLAQRLYRKIGLPLKRKLNGIQKIFLSLSGELYLIPFASLHDGHSFWGDNLNINYVSSGRDLLRKPVNSTTKSITVFANPDFNASSSNMRQTLRSASIADQKRSCQAFFAPLYGSAREAESIKKYFPSAKLLMGREATAEALLNVQSPAVLHIATHGILLGSNSCSGTESRREIVEDSRPMPSHPLLRSMLAMAGANMDTGTGLVTAFELSDLNLTGTQLVILSACKSGLGEIHNTEGVYGMRRAFITAGAETLVTSLWSVDDIATQRLMEVFYRHLKNGISRSVALQSAMREIRKTKEYRHPYYWAAFISIGRGEPLRGLTRKTLPKPLAA